MGAAINHFDFESRLRLMVTANRTEITGDYTWGNSVIKIGNTYHAYIERWSNVDGISGYAYYGKIFYASSANRLGPFNSMTELTELKSQTWTAGSVFNAVPIVVGNTIYMFWAGTTVETPAYPLTGTPARDNNRIGVAYTSIDTPEGPFTLLPTNPILPPVGDQLLTNNPYPFIAMDGSLKMIYKYANAALPDVLILAQAKAVGGDPLDWVSEGTITSVTNIEESAVWREGEYMFMVTKGQDATYVENQNGILLYNKTADTNKDGWTLVTSKTRAYRLVSNFADFTSVLRARIERPYVLVEDGEAKAFYTTVLYAPDTGSFNIGRAIKPTAN